MSQSETQPYYQAIHSEAIRSGQTSYTDPRTGYLVFTALFHQKRGYCCNSGCRHCPYG